MKKASGVAAFVGVLLLVCAIVGWEWYSNVGRKPPAQPVRQIAAGTPAPAEVPSPSATPVTYVPRAVPSTAPVQAASSTPQPQASPAGTVAPTPSSVTLKPYAAGSGSVTAPPMVASPLAPRVVSVAPVREPPDAPPRILAMTLSSPVAHGGEVVSGTVETSSNVATVEARIAGYSSPMQKVGVGRFVMSYRVPKLPFFLHRTYTIQVIARNTRGDAVTSSLPITIR